MSDNVREFSQFNELFDALPQGLDRNEVQELIRENDVGKSFLAVAEFLLSAFSLGIRQGVSFFGNLCAVILLGAILESVRKSFSAPGVQSAFDFLFLLVLAVFSYQGLEDAFVVTQKAIQGLNQFTVAAIPVSALILTMSGSLQAAAIQKANLSLTVSLVSSLVSRFLLPLLRGLFALNLAGAFSRVGIQGLFGFLKKTVKTLCLLFFTLLSALLGLQNALAVAGDSLLMRSVRFAAGNFIPVVGSLVGEASKTLAASLKLVRTECGLVCLIAVLFVILRPILIILVKKFFLSLAGSVAEMVGEKKSKDFLQNVAGLMDLILALLISQGVYFVFFITLFLAGQGSVV